MKRNRKGALMALALAAALALTACAAQGSGTLRVGVKDDVANFGLYDEESGRYSGMEIDLAELLGEHLGYSEVEFVTVNSSTREEWIDDGSLDMVIATYSVTPERKKHYDFSTPYYTDHVGVMVEDSSLIGEVAQLKGCTVGTVQNSTNPLSMASYMVSKRIISGFDERSFSAAAFDGGLRFREYETYAEAAEALEYGEVDAFVADGSILSGYVAEGRTVLPDVFAAQRYGVCTQKGSPLSARVDEAIRGWLADGTLSLLKDKWGI